MYAGKGILIGVHLRKEEDLDSGTSPVPPRARNPVLVRNGTGLELEEMSVDHCVSKRELTSVAAHVHAETIPEAIRPGLTLRDALLNSSEFFGENPVYRA